MEGQFDLHGKRAVWIDLSFFYGVMETELFEATKEQHFNRSELNNSLRDKKIPRSEWCAMCGEKTDRLEGHHSRYGRGCGLIVAFLCPVCHALADQRRRAREQGEELDW